MKKFSVEYKNRRFLVTAKDYNSAVESVNQVVNEVEDERLSPMTYKKLKEMGYGHDDWADWTQEQANKIVAEGRKPEQSKSSESQLQKQPQKSEVTVSKSATSEGITSEDVKEDYAKLLRSKGIESKDVSKAVYRKDGGFTLTLKNGDTKYYDVDYVSGHSYFTENESKSKKATVKSSSKPKVTENSKITFLENSSDDGDFERFVSRKLGENFTPENLTVKNIVDLWENYNGRSWVVYDKHGNEKYLYGSDLTYAQKIKLLQEEGILKVNKI